MRLKQNEELLITARRKGITNRQISKDLKWSEGSISMYFNGKANLSPRRLQKLIDYIQSK